MFEKEIVVTKIHSVLSFNNKNSPKVCDYSGEIAHNELILKLDGKSEIYFKNQSFTDIKGTVRFLPKTDFNVRYTSEKIEEGSCIDIFFDTLEPIASEAFAVNYKNFEKLSALFKRAENIWKKKQAGFEYTAAGCLYEILAILKQKSVYTPNKKIMIIKPAIDYIAENFTTDFNVTQLSSMCNVSYTYFKKIFTGIYNMTPRSYIIFLRIEYACDLLKSQMYKVSDVSELCGFLNVYYFSKCFKKHIGVSPSEYVKMNSKK